jgi:uncharacterized protein
MYETIWNNLSKFKQMIFIAGPRQAGKTTFTKILAETYTNWIYFNWDIIDEKRKLLENPFFYENLNRQDDSKPLLIFDELHKYAHWKNYLKSAFDRDHENYKFIVSGSGRLNLYQKGGDSLAGRYLLFHLWPFTVAELSNVNLSFEIFFNNLTKIPEKTNHSSAIWDNLKHYSGFPDPYIAQDKKFYNIWSNTYKKQLIREDIRDLTAIRSIENIEILFSLLPSRVGSLISMANLSQDIQVSFDSIKNWLELFENFFLIFRLSPWSKKISRAITKEKKVYLFDYAGLDSDAVKFENMVALELFRAVSNWNNLGYGNFNLNFVRNREKEEVDFLISNNNTPLLLIETKLSDDNPAKSLIKFQNMLDIPAVQVVDRPGVCKKISNKKNKILIISADHWLPILP